ncbi:MAG: ribonuclease Z [Promethearchaeota archaeon]
MDIIILGSAAAIPMKERNLPSIALRYQNELLLFDCGEDVQRRIIEAGLKFNKPMKILISHFHGDHIIGLPGLLFRFGLIERDAPLTIYGPRNLFLYLYLHKKILGLKANYPFKIIEIDHLSNKILEYDGLDSESPINEVNIENNIIFNGKKYSLKYTTVEHSVISFGYSFIEKPRSGKFNPERAIELEIPEGRLWKRMQEGQTIEYKGREINPEKEKIVGPKLTGRKITYSGDTLPSNNLIMLGKDSDVLIHEATFSNEQKKIAEKKKHSTSVDAANSALKMNAKKLILTHISSRYQEDAIILLEDAKKLFPNTILAEDLMKITIK